MKFPMLSDIATQQVVSISIDKTISEALDIMLRENHRNILVLDEKKFYILTIIDVLNLTNDGKNLDLKISELQLKSIPTVTKEKNVLDTLEFLNNSVEHICVVNSDGSLFGLVTHSDISSNIDPDTLMENYRLKDFLKLGRRMKWVSKNERTCDLLSKMTKEHFDNVVVVEEMVPVGILTTKDILRLIKERVDLTKDVSHYMTQPVQSVHNNASIKEALEFIKKKHFRRVVVVDSYNKLTGIIAQKELISLTYSKWATLMKDYQQELTELNRMLESKYKEFETKAATDALTGLYNRHKFIELYISSYRSMVQRDNHMSLILMDIDFFKLVNDNYGHNIGDQVLIQVSHTLLRNLRNIDIICRWGGEEFIVLLPTVDLETAKNIAQKIKSALEKTEIEIVGHVTASFGVSEIEVGEDMDEVIARADKALYLAKESGRNCVKTQMDI